MTTNRTGYINNLDTIGELTTARIQACRDYQEVAEIVATVLGQHDCDGVSIVELEVALHDYFFEIMHAYDQEIDHRLEEICNTAGIMSEEEE